MWCPTIDREMPDERCAGYRESGLYSCCVNCRLGDPDGSEDAGDNRESVNIQEERMTKEEKICTKCKKPKPIERFVRKHKGSEERRQPCLDCIAEYQRNRKAKLKAGKVRSKASSVRSDDAPEATPNASPLTPHHQEKPEPAPRQETPAPVVPQDEDQILENQLTLDFSCYPEVLQEIKRIAHHEERPPEVQARYMLKRVLQDGWGDEVGARYEPMFLSGQAGGKPVSDVAGGVNA